MLKFLSEKMNKIKNRIHNCIIFCKNKYLYLNKESWIRGTLFFGVCLSLATIGIYWRKIDFAQPITAGFWCMYAMSVYYKYIDYMKQKKSQYSPPPEEFYR